MTAILVDDCGRDIERLEGLLRSEGLHSIALGSGAGVEAELKAHLGEASLVILQWELPGPPFAFELLRSLRNARPDLPVVVTSGALDASLAARAFALGASDFLAKPLDSNRARVCIRDLLSTKDPMIPLVRRLREEALLPRGERLLGESKSFLSALRRVAKVIGSPEVRVLLLGESGTGKELLARAIHQLGSGEDRPMVSVNLAEIPGTLIEAALFGHERGAFTDARELRRGFLEQVRDGTLFLDEIGELDSLLQVKLLRVVQEREFRRIGSSATLPFQARLICATNRDLARDVAAGRFRRDLFHRIAEVTITVPPLRERAGDVDVLLTHFLELNRGSRLLRFAPETLTILRSYSFPGNVRELENLIKCAVMDAEGDFVLPRHLPLTNMGTFLSEAPESVSRWATNSFVDSNGSVPSEFLAELNGTLPPDWLDQRYRSALAPLNQAFDRAFLQRKLRRHRQNVTRAAAAAGLDTKTFRKHWKDCGLPPLGDDSEDAP